VDKSRSRAGGGSGIGLTISKHLVEAHNGCLTASSPGLNQGSTFTLVLPVTR
jgi:histidine kinase